MNEIDFGKLFNHLCEQSGKTNTEIAKGLDVDKATIGRWRSGERSPKLTLLPKIAEYFNVDIQLFSKSKNLLNQEEPLFKDPIDAFRYILDTPLMANYGGYDLQKMSDQEMIDFANEIADYARYIAQRKFGK